MPDAPQSIDDFVTLIQQSRLVSDDRLEAYLAELFAVNALPERPAELAEVLWRDGLLTRYQSEELLKGRWKRFSIGKYRILERIGVGGMGKVYLCENPRMNRRVAIKILPISTALEPGVLERFEREAKLAATLAHPNIVRTFDIDRDDDLHFIVMEFIEGQTLQQLVAETGPMSFPLACDCIRQVAIGLQHAHEVGLVHRDIKPANIMIDANGVAKLLDLGLARAPDDESDMLTQKYNPTAVLGTADYIAPEQVQHSAVDIRADIYGLGGTFYYCLTGSPPFGEGTPAEKMGWHQTRQPDPIYKHRSDIPLPAVFVLNKMIAKDPARRQQTPHEVADALEKWVGDRSDLAAMAVPDGPGGSANRRVTSSAESPPTMAMEIPVASAPASEAASTSAIRASVERPNRTDELWNRRPPVVEASTTPVPSASPTSIRESLGSEVAAAPESSSNSTAGQVLTFVALLAVALATAYVCWIIFHG